MRRLLFTLASLAFCLVAAAQNNAADLIAILGDSRVSLQYSYSDAAGSEMGKGIATVQGHCYKVVESGTAYYNDGKTLWTVNNHAKEIYIENAGSDTDIFGNLDKILENVGNLAIEGTRVSFTMAVQGLPEDIHCKATILRKAEYSKDLSEFQVDISKYDKLWVITDLR
ncbi:MAG: hypothetical protein K6F21_03370 [Bacteroidales bacterium]|nr:hypothetical protein [Bacteroidales bacterium]